MSITLITGQPGAGKSLFAVSEIKRFTAAGRPCFHIGIDDLRVEVAPQFGKSLECWRELPEGAVLFVDEAHKHCPPMGPGKPPEWIEALAEIRHMGIDLVLITQHPSSVHHFVRKRVNRHVHVVRKMGLQRAMLHEWDGVQSNPRDYHAAKESNKRVWKYPRELFGCYRSATLHQVERRVPWLVPVACVGIVAALGVILAAVLTIGDLDAAEPTATEPVSAHLEEPAPTFADAVPVLSQRQNRPLTAEEYVVAHLPRIEGVPWSAPVYDGKDPERMPDVLCMLMEKRGCRCYTEQMTRLEVSFNVCRRIAVDGIYNPYRGAQVKS